MATNGNVNHEQYASAAAAQAEAPKSHSKDEVGWYFVEQYYNTLSKHPHRLHLFYNKRSQFVQGLEAQVSDVAVGREAISERIKELDFQECKVRVSNVDSQASYDNIVIQVIGEISNKSGEPKKFVQTFVLAQQPAGYYLLNDIMRYIDEGEEETTEVAGEEATPAVEVEAPQELAAEAEPEQVEPEEPAKDSPVSSETLDAQAVDKKLEEPSSDVKDTPSTSSLETPATPAPAVQETPSKPEVEATPEAAVAAEEVAEEVVKKPEIPKEPSPTPAPASTPAPARTPVPEPEKPKGPPKPMTWASRIAAAAGPTAVKPVVPLPAKATATPVKPQTAATPAPAPAAAAVAPAASPAAAQPSAPAQTAETPAQHANKEANEWRTAGADTKKQSRQQSAAAPSEKEGTLAYVKFVTEKVKDDDLRSALGTYGDLVYFDINRSKNCAFVEFGTVTSCQAAIKASPITVQGESIAIEPRRPKAGAYGGANYSSRGSISGRGRGGFEGNRSGSQGSGRGGYTARGRGGASRGRGGAQAANA